MKPGALRRLLPEALFAVALAATVGFMLHVGLHAIGQALTKLGVGGILLLALAHAPSLVVLGLSWWLLAGEAGGPKPAKFVWGRLMRDASGDLLPFSPIGGYVIGVRAVVLTGISGVEAAISGLLDLIAEQVAKIPYSIAAAALLFWLVPESKLVGPTFAILALTLAAFAIGVFKRSLIRKWILKAAAGVERRWPGSGSADGGRAEAALGAMLARRPRIAASLGLHLAGWLFGAAEAWLALHLLGASITFGEAMVIDGLYVVVRTFAFAIPAAVGVQEGSYVVLCGLFGVDAPTALAYSLIKRARDVVVGGPAVLAWQVLERQRRSSRAAVTC
jgi:putative membrane protein